MQNQAIGKYLNKGSNIITRPLRKDLNKYLHRYLRKKIIKLHWFCFTSTSSASFPSDQSHYHHQAEEVSQ